MDSYASKAIGDAIGTLIFVVPPLVFCIGFGVGLLVGWWLL